MTVYRAPGSVEAVLLGVIRVLSPEDIEAATGKHIDTIRAMSNPNKRDRLGLEDAAALDAALKARGYAPEFGPLFAEIERRTAERIAGRRATPPNPERALRRVMAETGDLARVFDDAMADGRLTPAERREIADEAQQVIDAARHIRDTVEPPADNVTDLRRSA